MAITPQQFFSKNMKWIVLILFILLLFKTIQSCNRETFLDISSKTYIVQIDSLKKQTQIYHDSIKQLNFNLKIADRLTSAANERANAVQSTAEKIKANTTITVKGVEKN